MADETEDLTEQILKDASRPQSVSTPGLTVTRHNLRDLIEMDKHLTRKRAARSKLGGIKMVRSCPPPMG